MIPVNHKDRYTNEATRYLATQTQGIAHPRNQRPPGMM